MSSVPDRRRVAPPPPLSREACAAEVIDVVPKVMNAMRTSMRRSIGDGLSVPQFRCLGFIDRHPGASVSEVAAFLGVTLATASAMVDRLARAAYVDAATSEVDRRRSALTIRPPGRALLDRIRDGARADMAAALEGASPAELSAVMDGLATLKSRFVHG